MQHLIIIALFVFSTINDYQKGTREISIESNKSIIEIGRLLVEDGYTIAKSDTTFNFLETSFQPVGNISTKMIVRKSGSRVKLTGQFLSGVSIEMYGVRSEDKPEAIEKRGMGRSPYMVAFDEMARIAELIGK